MTDDEFRELCPLLAPCRGEGRGVGRGEGGRKGGREKVHRLKICRGYGFSRGCVRVTRASDLSGLSYLCLSVGRKPLNSLTCH